MLLIWRDIDTMDGVLRGYDELCNAGFAADCCVPFPVPFPDACLETASAEALPDFSFAGPVRIVSEAMKRVLEGFEVHAEFSQIPVRKNGREEPGFQFYCMNLLDALECFDYTRSDFHTSEWGVSGINRLVLNEEESQGRDLFFLGPFSWGDERNPRAINNIICCASAKLAKAVRNAELSGVTFVPPEHWNSHPAENVAWRPE